MKAILFMTQTKESIQMTELELMVRKIALKDVELWLNEQYLEIEKQLLELNDKSNEGEN
jgi:hypothetical protein